MTPAATPHVVFVGAGPGDPDLLTLAAADALTDADAVITDRHCDRGIVARHCRADVEVVDAGTGDHDQQLTQASRAKLIVRTARTAAPGHVVRLLDGDPAAFSGWAQEALACHRAGITFDVVPGVSAVTAVPAYAGIPLTSTDAGHVHVLDGTSSRSALAAAGAAADGTVVVLGSGAQLAATAAALLSHGRDEASPVAVTEHGTRTRQRTVVTTLGEVAQATAGMGDPVLAVVGGIVHLRGDLSWFETKPLFGWQVVVPRTKEQSGSMMRRLATHGATGDLVPTISVEPPRNPNQIARAIRGLVTGTYEWIGFTSANAVKAVREKLEALGLDARAFSGVKIAAVGGVTARALADWGLRADLVPSGEQSARGLLADWPAYDRVLDPINRVFLPRADIATETLAAGLVELGWEVDDVTAYRTVRAAPPPAATRDAIKSGHYDAVLFTSSSTVRNLIGIAGKPHPSTVVACIGPATVKTAEEHGLAVDVMAPEPSALALVDALADFGQARAATALAEGVPVQRPSQRRPPARRRAR